MGDGAADERDAERVVAEVVEAGVRDVPGDKMGMIALAFTHSTSDFPLLLANVAQKSMLKGYDEAPETFQQWTSAGTLPDFKIMSSVDIGSFPALRQVAEVKDVFEVPLAFLMDPAHHERHSRDWQGHTRYYYAMPWQGRYIWGATAGMIRNLYRLMYESP